MDQFEELKKEIEEKKKTTEAIEKLPATAFIALFDIVKAVPEICREGAFIQFDPETKRLFSLPFNKASKKYFVPMITDCSLDVTDLNTDA